MIQDRNHIVFKCPNCGYRPYADQFKVFYKKDSSSFEEVEKTSMRLECSECGRRDLVPMTLSDDDYYEACREANKDYEVDPYEKWSYERREKIYKNASPEKLNRLLELMRRYNRINSLMILEYFDGNANGTDESDYTITWEIYKLLVQAQKDGKVFLPPCDKEDDIVQDCIPFSNEETDKAIIKIMKEENKR